MSLFAMKEKQVQRVVLVPIASIVPNKSQPRKQFDEVSLYSLSQSIKENGILQPVCVRRVGALYELISGERRCRAAKLAGLTEIPVIIMDVDEERSAVLALIENIQRSNLSFFEEAIAINELITVFGLTQQEAAKQLGKAQSTIANKLRLLRFTDAERSVLLECGVSERQARALIRIDDEKLRSRVLYEVVKKRASLEQTEQLVNEALSGVERCSNKSRKSIFNIPVPRVYLNSINRIVNRMKDANIVCDTITNMCEDHYEYIIRIPVKNAQS